MTCESYWFELISLDCARFNCITRRKRRSEKGAKKAPFSGFSLVNSPSFGRFAL